MKDSKLVSILKTFSKDEFKEFEKFIDSPFFSTGRNLKPLYIALKKFYPSFESPKFSYENIFSMLNKNVAYNAILIRRLFSDMIKMAEEYLLQKAMKDWFPMEKYAFLCLALDRKLLGKDTLEIAEKSDKLWEKYGIDSNFFRGKIHNELARVSAHLNMDQQIKVAQNVFNISDFFVTYFFSGISQCIKNMMANKDTFNIDYSQVNAYRLTRSLDIDKAIDIYKGKNENYAEITLMYMYEIKALLANHSDEPYFEFKKLFFKNFDKLSFSEKYDLFGSLTHCIIILMGKNYNKFTKELFEINKYKLLKGAYKHSESLYFPVIIFRAIFFTALNAEETAWARNFLAKYVDEVIPEHRDSLENICQAAIFIAEGKYEKAIDCMKNVTDDFISFNLDKRVLTLICFSELGYYENALSLLDASKHFLKNNKTVSAVNNIYYKKFFDIFAKLMKMYVSGDFEDSLAIKKHLVSNLPVPFSSWIMKKLDV